MHLGPLLTPRDAGLLAPRQSGHCIDCPAPPPCLCASDEQCIQINRSCYNCFTFKCVKQNDSSSSGGKKGISGGAVAGAVIGILLFLAAVVVAFLWYRRRWSRRPDTREVKPDVPASAADVLSRPDPAEKPASPAPPTNNYQVYSNQSNTTIDLTNQSRGVTPSASVPNPFASHRSSVQSDPFQDNHSIQTTSTGTQGTNVIPIALVAPNSNPSLTQPAEASSGVTTPPDRPVRSPELNLEHVNVSRDELRAPRYAPSAISGISGVSSRHSYMSGASFSSDFLNEDPVIVTGGTKGGVRQVLGVHQAQVLHAPSSPGTPLTPSLKSRPSVRSPLAASSFTPAEAPQEMGREDDNRSLNSQGPFSDKEASPSYSQTTFGTPSAQDQDHPPVYQAADEARTPVAENLQVPWRQNENRASTRPSSMATQAGSMIAESVIDIGSATRVNVGQAISPPATGSSFPRSPYRTTMGRLVTPSAASLKSPDSASTGSSFEDQQRAALAHAQAQAQAQGLNRRVSGSTVASGVSLRADSILESFPFVPPSPISSRPVRSPPRSPLNQQFATVNSSSSEGRQSAAQPESATLPLEPPNRKFLGLSTASNSSTNSTGLGSFPFHVEEPPSTEARKAGGPPPPTSYPPAGFQRTRASLDTLALTSDLTSYPLGFDRRGHDAA